MVAADPKFSAGARLERAAFRAFIRRAMKRRGTPAPQVYLDWVLQRQRRYEKKPGGLGK